MTTMRPPYQWELAFPKLGPGEAAGRRGQEAEMATAALGPESPAVSEPRSPLNPPNRRVLLVNHLSQIEDGRIRKLLPA
jgi:hypothetical protein